MRERDPKGVDRIAGIVAAAAAPLVAGLEDELGEMAAKILTSANASPELRSLAEGVLEGFAGRELATRAARVDYSRIVDEAIAAADGAEVELIDNVGKDWVLPATGGKRPS